MIPLRGKRTRRSLFPSVRNPVHRFANMAGRLVTRDHVPISISNSGAACTMTSEYVLGTAEYECPGYKRRSLQDLATPPPPLLPTLRFM